MRCVAILMILSVSSCNAFCSSVLLHPGRGCSSRNTGVVAHLVPPTRRSTEQHHVSVVGLHVHAASMLMTWLVDTLMRWTAHRKGAQECISRLRPRIYEPCLVDGALCEEARGSARQLLRMCSAFAHIHHFLVEEAQQVPKIALFHFQQVVDVEEGYAFWLCETPVVHEDYSCRKAERDGRWVYYLTRVYPAQPTQSRSEKFKVKVRLQDSLKEDMA